MSHIIDTFMAVFVMVLMLLFGTSIIKAQSDTASARTCKNDIVAELENSAYNPTVINSCITQSKAEGYAVTITLFRKNQTSKIYTEATALNTDSVDAVAARVDLSYQYRLTYIGNSSTHVIRGFAR